MGGVVEVIVRDNRSCACADRNFYWPPSNLGPVVIHQDLHPDRRDVAYIGNFTECTEDVITDTDGHRARLLAVHARRELDASNGKRARERVCYVLTAPAPIAPLAGSPALPQPTGADGGLLTCVILLCTRAGRLGRSLAGRARRSLGSIACWAGTAWMGPQSIYRRARRHLDGHRLSSAWTSRILVALGRCATRIRHQVRPPQTASSESGELVVFRCSAETGKPEPSRLSTRA
ncbi:hypothetical protein T492DRAFT_352729 [Pavlovales sp. CCMP2436]|nr:hypothetical protein T492DRAFT_352729 [Pavlovales sp. CCMP2436]